MSLSRKEYQREWHNKNKERRSQLAKERQREIKSWFYEYKKRLRCERCGFDKNPVALDFHHVKDKGDTINELLRQKATKDRILEEISKCIVLCANCHRIEHDVSFGNEV